MPDFHAKRLVFQVEVLTAIPIDGTDKLAVTIRTASNQALTLRLTRPEASELMDLILAERARGRPAAAAAPPA